MNEWLPEGFPEPAISSGVGKGWWPLIQEVHEKLLAIDPNYKVDQVKEKFGGLRYYWSSDLDMYDQFNAIVGEAEERSTTICETCGKPGKLRPGGWVLTECDEHAK